MTVQNDFAVENRILFNFTVLKSSTELAADWSVFNEHVLTLPVDAASSCCVVIRCFIARLRFTRCKRGSKPTSHSTTLLNSSYMGHIIS